MHVGIPMTLTKMRKMHSESSL